MSDTSSRLLPYTEQPLHRQCSKPFDAFGIQYVRIEVKGQSFMLHQIRKMIGIYLLDPCEVS